MCKDAVEGEQQCLLPERRHDLCVCEHTCPLCLGSGPEVEQCVQDYHKLVVDEVALKAIEQNMYGSRPRELFEDVLEEVEEDFMKTRSHLRDAKVMEILADTSFNDYNAALESLEDARTVPEHHK